MFWIHGVTEDHISRGKMVCRDHEGEMPISKENRDPSKSIRELHMENVAAANILQSLRDSNAQLVQEVQSLQHKVGSALNTL